MEISDVSKNWNRLAVFAAALMGSLAGFLVMPPTGPEGSSWKQFSVFFVALFAGLWLVPVNRWDKKGNAGRWCLVALVTVLLGLGASLSYNNLLDAWTVPYWREQRAVVGRTRTTAGQRYAATLAAQQAPTDDLRVLQGFQGRARDAWREEEISARELRLDLLYILTVFLLTSAVIAVLQGIYCSTKDDADAAILPDGNQT